MEFLHGEEKMPQRKGVIYNEAGDPFSRWRPAEKFEYVFGRDMYRSLWKHARFEHEFCESRKWRFDYAWPGNLLAVEIDGFGFGHQAQQRIAENNEKRNHAVTLGWRVLVYDSRLLGSAAGVEDAITQVAKLLCGVSGDIYHDGGLVCGEDGT